MTTCKSIGYEVYRINFRCKCVCHKLKTTTELPFYIWRTNGTTRKVPKTFSPQLYHIVGTISATPITKRKTKGSTTEGTTIDSNNTDDNDTGGNETTDSHNPTDDATTKGGGGGGDDKDKTGSPTGGGGDDSKPTSSNDGEVTTAAPPVTG